MTVLFLSQIPSGGLNCDAFDVGVPESYTDTCVDSSDVEPEDEVDELEVEELLPDPESDKRPCRRGTGTST